MARPGITFDQVQAAADRLSSEGKTPTILGVREVIGSGSPNTIQPLLAKWRESRPVITTKKTELPDGILSAIAAEIDKAATAARAEIEERLVQSQTEAADLAAIGDTVETERDALAEKVLALTTDRDGLMGKVEQLSIDLEQARSDAAKDQKAAEDARVALAKAQVSCDAQSQTVQHLQADNAELRRSLKEATQGRIDAEKESAVLASKIEASEQRTMAAMQTIEKLESRLTDAASAQEKTEIRLADFLQSAETAKEKLETRLAEALRDAATAREHAARLEGQIEALHGQSKQPDKKSDQSQKAKEPENLDFFKDETK